MRSRFRIAALVAGATLLSVPGRAAGALPTFTDVTSAAGIQHVHGFNLGNTDAMTGGAAARDYDGDGWIDIVFTRFNDPPILYRNLGNGTFMDVTSSAGLDVVASQTNGAVWGDIDNDGDPDLYLTSVKQGQLHQLFINNGNGTFTEDGAARGAGIDVAMVYRYGTSASFGDYDGDGWLDIHANEWGATGVSPPAVLSHARLLRNNGASAPGTFTDVTQAAGVSLDDQYATGPVVDPGQGAWSFSSRFTDLDLDGHPDLVIASDFNTSRLYWNDGDGTFTDGTVGAGVGTDENGMGLTVADYDADGLFDVFITSIFHTDPPNQGHNAGGNYGVTGNRLFRNNGNRTFSDMTDSAGVREGAWGWGAAFLDFDNDGHLDLAMTNGFEGPSSDFYTDSVRLWRNDGTGRFENVGALCGFSDTGLGKGLLTLDYDDDGDLDLVVVNNGATPILYRNDGGNANPWLKVALQGTLSNRDAVGSIVTVTPTLAGPSMVREIDGASNFLSHSDITAHFGLGGHVGPVYEVSVRWPNGAVQVVNDVAPYQTLELVQAGGTLGTGGDALAVLLGAGLLALAGAALRRRRYS